MGIFDACFCTDEDVATRNTTDLPLLVPQGQLLAEAADGVLAAGDPWRLQAGADFAAAGFGPGNILLLNWRDRHRVANVVYGVATAAVGGLVLKRIGMPAGMPGLPPPPQSGASYTIPTFYPQIVRATADLNQLFQLAGPASLVNVGDLTTACTLLVTIRLLIAGAAGKDNADAWIAKAKLLMKEWDGLAANLAGDYGPSEVGQQPYILDIEATSPLVLPAYQGAPGLRDITGLPWGLNP